MPAPLSRPVDALPWAVFVGAFLVLAAAAAPGVSFHDSGEFALAAASGGIPHPPGAPTWCLSALAFVGVGRAVAPHAEVAYLTNLHSAFWAAATVALTGLVARLWSDRLGGGTFAAVAAQLVPAGVLLTGAAFVEQATITEQYTLLTALMAASLALAARLTATPAPRTAAALGLCIGLAIGNHLSQLVLLAVPLLCLWEVRERRLRLAAAHLAGLLAGLSVFAYLPLRSRVNPVLDFGNPDTPERFVAALTRQQWKTRPFADAPAGFASEWLRSYDFAGQIGWIGLALALAGAALLLRRAPLRLLATLLIGVGYAAGLLLAHLRQDKIDLAYLRGYGVADWHLPLYTLAALLAGVVAAALPRNRQSLAAVAAALLALAGATVALTRHSLRGWSAPDRFLADVLKPIPSDALIVPSGDNLFCMLGYKAYAGGGLGGRWIGWGGASPTTQVGRPGWDRATYLTYLATDPKVSLHAPALADHEARSRPLLVEYAAGNAPAARFLRPAGYLFQVEPVEVSDDEARQAERELHARFPELFTPATGHEHRLEREARGLMHQNRAAYFYEREMWREAADAFTLANTFLPDDGRTWFTLAAARESLGDYRGAAAACAEAIRVEPDLPGPRTNLAVLLARAGKFNDARALLEEELSLHPNHKDARANLAVVERQISVR